ncbi:oxidoreductase [Rhodococcus sp. 15-725-2-2b]|uniref:SDR family NAD(P)-dependent oxidoreductase n=1 Tax=unclassified Rhodococcus (in: high G+C Gram-positive bacteria) TaxID=192944 RepID=UPI000B9C3754|nr:MULTISPECIES: SDR family oxidoreductase [unclassified Rhodococcus (in: high G+C Gram-positive bacteria)]OZC63661.1 oxidoreductase [Rhodococcus sp. 06-469-3-2]OZD40826.1 oxidoreductase [Rhodococcus sp. 06-1477-1A]OZE67066.1 oxidoreductase [Rhodococcus sp. 15-725-2-2b]
MSVDIRPATLAGRTALVTGGSRGVGAGVARELAHLGADVAITYNRRPEDAEDVLTAVRRTGVRAMALQLDVADTDSAAGAVEQIAETLGVVDLFVSNAGIASTGRSIARTSLEEFGRLMAVHAWGPIALIQHLLPGMRALDRSDIVMVSSAVTATHPPATGPYVIAKQAMESACKVLALEEREHGVHVNIVAPGLVATDMGRRLVGAGGESSDFDSTAATSPFGRVCTPADVGAVVGFLTGSAAEYLTGVRLAVDGGGATASIY